MYFQARITYCRFAPLILLISLAAAQDNRPEVPYVPTIDKGVEIMLKLADVKRTDVVYDLGCGDGRIVIAAARIYGAHGVGIDINPQRIQEAKENAKHAGVENLVRFDVDDLFKADIHQANVVTLFLLQKVNLRLRPKLLSELKPGTRIVSNTFDMGDWKPDKKEILNGQSSDFGLGIASVFSHQFFLWIIPNGVENKLR
jgi:SAM-dependent methyltransferase